MERNTVLLGQARRSPVNKPGRRRRCHCRNRPGCRTRSCSEREVRGAGPQLATDLQAGVLQIAERVVAHAAVVGDGVVVQHDATLRCSARQHGEHGQQRHRRGDALTACGSRHAGSFRHASWGFLGTRKAPAEAGAFAETSDQNDASSSSITSLSSVSMTSLVLVSSGRKFFAKNDATAILPS